MGDVINLNKYRKQREREAAERSADQNRLKHGESPTARERRNRKQAADDKQLDGHKLEE